MGAKFLAGQVSAQLLQSLGGLLLIWALPTEAYGVFAVALGLQMGFGTILETGTAVSLTALVGDKLHDRVEVAGYMAAAKRIRNWLFTFTVLLCVALFPLLTWKHDWGWSSKLSLLAAVIATLFFQRMLIYNALLLLMEDLKSYYLGQFVVQGLKLGCFGLFWGLGLLSAESAMWLTALVTAVQGVYLQESSKRYIGAAPSDLTRYVRTMASSVWTYLPGTLITAFDSQLALGILLLVGSTTNVGRFAAVARLGALFGIVSAVNRVLLGPWLARKPSSVALQSHGVGLLGSFTICCLMCIVGWFGGPVALRLLGPSYSDASVAASLALVSASVTYFESAVWNMNAARGISYYWYHVGIPILRLGTLGLGAMIVDVSKIENLLTITLLSNVLVALLGLFTTVYAYKARLLAGSHREDHIVAANALPSE